MNAMIALNVVTLALSIQMTSSVAQFISRSSGLTRWTARAIFARCSGGDRSHEEVLAPSRRPTETVPSYASLASGDADDDRRGVNARSVSTDDGDDVHELGVGTSAYR